MNKKKIVMIDSISCVGIALEPQIGPLIIRDILAKSYDVELLSFTTMAYRKEIELLPKIYDNIKQFANIILNKKPDIVSFYTMCDSFYVAIRLAEEIKNRDSSIKIIMAGPHATLIAKEILENFNFVDIISMGEGENTIEYIMEALINGEIDDNVKGVAYRKEGIIKINTQAELIKNEELSEYTPYNFEPYIIDKDEGISIEGGRGCPFGCTFCSTSSFWGRKYRVKPIDDLINEMKKYNEMYGFNVFNIQHDLFTANKKVIESFCNRIIDENLPYKWGCSSRVDVLNKDLITLMKKANCSSMFLGIETGSKRMQKILNKNLNIDAAYETIKFMKDTGLELCLSFIYCYPDETIEDFYETAKMIEMCFKLGIKENALHVFISLPSTKETDKIMDKVFFDTNYLESTIFLKGIYSEEDLSYIQKYPQLFIQFFTFESEVRKRYGYFHVLVESLRISMKVYEGCIKYILNNHGLIELYENYVSEIEELNRNIEKLNYDEEPQYKFSFYYRFMEKVIDDECKKDSENYYLQELYRFENLIMKSREEGKHDPRIYEFKLDVFKARKTGDRIHKKTFAEIYNKGGVNVHVTKLVSNELLLTK